MERCKAPESKLVNTSKNLPVTNMKKTGRAFYESLGSPKMVLAPMVDQSEFVRASSKSVVAVYPDIVF